MMKKDDEERSRSVRKICGFHVIAVGEPDSKSES